MAKPPEKTGSTAPRQIAPPPFSQHLRELASRPDAWQVLARNLIPVVGIYGFGWSAALAVFNYWFDGLTALAAIVAALIPRALRETQPKSVGVTSAMNLMRGVVTWIFLVAIVGLPYWIVLIPLHDLLLGDALRRELAHSPALCFVTAHTRPRGTRKMAKLTNTTRKGIDTKYNFRGRVVSTSAILAVISFNRVSFPTTLLRRLGRSAFAARHQIDANNRIGG